MAKYDFRILLESVEGQQTSYISQSFVDTSVDLVLSASQVYNRITQFSGSGGAWELDSHATASSGMISCSYQNSPIFSQSSAGTYTTAGVSNADFDDEFTFKDNTFLSASLNGGVVTGSIDFISTPSEDYDRLLRYKFFGEKVCSVLGLPSNQWIYVDQVRFPVDDDSNIFQGNIDVNTAFISNTLTFANNANVNSDIPFYIDTGSDRYIKFIDERSTGSLALIMGYDKDDDLYEISADTEKRFDIKNVDNMINLSRITGSEGVLRVSNALHIIDDQPTFTLKSTLNDRDFSIINANGAVRLVNSSDSDSVLSDIEIQTAGFDNAVYIDDSADSVGIGTATPDATLHVAGTLKVDGNAEFVGAVTSSIISSSVIFSSGSNIFGDADDDTHTFFGDITASGDISASGKIITPQVGDGNDNLILRGDNVTIQTDASGDIFFKEATTTKFKYDGGEDSFTFTGNITASNNISASGQLIAASADFNDGNITNVGTLKLDELKADTTDEVVISLSGAGMGFNVDGGDVYLFNEGGTDADWKYVDAADVVLIHGDAGLSRVGISDTSPVSKLDVGGDLNVQSHITASGNISCSGNIIGELTGIDGDVTGVDSILNTGLKIGRDSTDLIDFATADNVIGFRVGNNDEMKLNTTSLQPATSNGLALGASNRQWSDLFLAEGGVINFDNGDVTLTQTGNNLTMAGGSLSASGDFGVSGTATITTNKFNKTSNTDADHQGDVVFFGGTTSMDNGKIYHYKSDGTWELADADAVANCDGLLAVALGAASDTNGMLLRGTVTLDHDPGAVGDVLYASSVAGLATPNILSTSGNIVRVIGYCLDASNGQIWFNPSSTFVEVA